MSNKEKDVKKIFSAAVESYEPHQWNEYLVKACGEDDALRQQVRGLLDAHLQNDSFLDQNVDVTKGEPLTERAGTQIGQYKLLQEIGEGGFGTVYMAEQTEPVHRKVAFKIIKPGMDTKQVVARFEAERQALAMMDHPSIAKVLDAGTTESGRPYFVMELVKGVPITEFCDTNKLSNPERLELFTTVCHAIQHAHQKGVIHRDLKPTNVMVTLHDNKPMPVVIDFGIAKAISHQLTEKTLFTAYGQMVGTPAYMSPEQAQMSRMDIDTRSDIYSLGVLLYELLTGSTPLSAEELRGTAYVELQRRIREEEAQKPSIRLSTLGKALAKVAQDRSTDPGRLGQFIRGDLDWIVLKALDKERSRRYDSANGLARDIQRFLNDEAIEARPPSVAYQLRKFVGRHRAVVTTVAAIGIAILLGIIGTTYGMLQAKHDEEIARVALEDAEQSRLRAAKLADEKADEADHAKAMQKQAEAERAKAKKLVAAQLASQANIAREQGDISLAALLSAEALAQDEGTEREQTHRLRLAADLRQCPRPTVVMFHDSTILCANRSENGKWIATADDQGVVRIWSSATGKIIEQFQHNSQIQELHFVLDDSRLLVKTRAHIENGNGRGFRFAPRAIAWDWNSRKLLFECNGFVKNYKRATLVAQTTEDKRRLECWSLIDGKKTKYSFESIEEILRFKYISDDHRRILVVTSASDASAGDDLSQQLISQKRRLTFHVWDAESGSSRVINNEKGVYSGAPNISTSIDHQLMAISVDTDEGQGCKVFRTETGEQMLQIVDGDNSIRPEQFSPDGSMLLCQSGNELILVKLDSGEILPRRIPILSFNHWGKSAFISPDGKRILSLNRQGDPQIWSTDTMQEVCPPMEQKSTVAEFKFSEDGRYILVVDVKGTARVWGGMDGQPVTPIVPTGSTRGARFSADVSHLMIADQFRVWRMPIAKPNFETTTLPINIVYSPNGQNSNTNALMSANGKRVATRVILPTGHNCSEIQVWDTEQTRSPIFGPVRVNSADPTMSFDSTGKRLIVTVKVRSKRNSAERASPDLNRTIE